MARELRLSRPSLPWRRHRQYTNAGGASSGVQDGRLFIMAREAEAGPPSVELLLLPSALPSTRFRGLRAR